MITPIIDTNSINELKRLIGESNRAVITCHLSPDGDALGSSLGLALVLSALDKNVSVVVPDMPPANLMFLPGAKEVVVASANELYAARLIERADLLFVLDYNDPKRVDRLASRVAEAQAKKVMIDHHLFPAQFCDVTISHPEVSSTSMLLFHVLCQMQLADVIDKQIAECIFTGMMTDTGNFSYNSNDPDLYEAIAFLLRRGINKDAIYKKVFHCNTPSRMRLNGYAIDQKMEILEERPGAIISLSRQELNHYGYRKGDTEGLVNEPLSIPELQFSFFLREEEDSIKISARSKGDYPVNKICEDHFGGGGHKNAAGGNFSGSIEEATLKIKEVLPAYDPYLPKKLI